ncbi:At2g23090 like protein [Fimicolochytrium jonesii]|uniref:At2g23090 like protein n=1 Tax=Fimicolochytrium jonesii TaxID=1396493 RepID=UPI0022FE3A70|nr:At2g23090 like protein [Fimicolochytrium jonesii]KAI8818620.1 At2g23090 like protein [Fimicolochytrium jonesii]
MKREKNAARAGLTAKSQLKVNEAAKNTMCSVCRQTFLMTIRQKALEEHVTNKHAGKDFKTCFPTFVPTA